MKIVFAGTPEFARLAYEAIVQAGFDVPLVMTQPDRRSGRGMKLVPSPVKSHALELGAEVAQPTSLRLDGKYPEEAAQAKAQLLELQPDVMVVAAYGLILPQWVLDLPKYGCLNIHASLLPRWRGAAPIQRAIEAGDASSGVSIMQMDVGLDTGDVVAEAQVSIGQMNASELHDELARVGAEQIVQVLKNMPDSLSSPKKQDESQVTYAEKLDKAEARLSFDESAEVLARKIRAFNPVPGATLPLPGFEQALKIWEAQVLDSSSHASASPGEVVQVSPDGIDMQTAQGILRIKALQKPGGKRQAVASFVQGWQSKSGQ